jgi:hypothetical protein
LEGRKLALAEEEFKVRAAVALEGGRKRIPAEVVNSSSATGGGDGDDRAKLELGGPGADKRLREAVGQAFEVLNRGGSLEERMLEARCLLAEGVRQS